jgi:DNA-directed RNA polymerase specialized sigma24 family protein
MKNITMQELLEKGAKALLSPPKANGLSLPLEECYASESFWADLRRYVLAALWRHLRAAYRSDITLRTDNPKGPATPKNTPNSYKYATYHHEPQPEDVEDITQDTMERTLEHWEQWADKIREEYGEDAKGIHLARYVARRALYLHLNEQDKLQRQGLLGPDFWHIVPDSRRENDFVHVLNQIYWEQVTDPQVNALLQYLAQGYGHGEACELIGISRKTGRRWLDSLAIYLLEQAAHR